MEPTARPGLAGQVAMKRGRDPAHRLANNPETGCRWVAHHDSLIGNGTVAIVAEHSDLSEVRARIEQGGARKYHEAAAAAERIVGRELPSQVLRAGPRTRTIPA